MLLRWHYPNWSSELGGYPMPLFRVDEYLSGQYPAVTDFFALLSFSKLCADQPIAIQDLERAEQFLRAALLHDGLLILMPEIIVFPRMRSPGLLILGRGWYPHPHIERYHFTLPYGLLCAIRRVISSVPMHLNYITWDALYFVDGENLRSFFREHSKARKELKTRQGWHACGAGCGYFNALGKNLNEYVGRQRYYDQYIGERVLLSLYKSPVTAYLSQGAWSEINFLRYAKSHLEVCFKDNRRVACLNEIEKVYHRIVSAESERSPIRLPFLLSCVLSYATTREDILDVSVQLREQLIVPMRDVWHNVFDMDRMVNARDSVRIEKYIREAVQREIGNAFGFAGSLEPAEMISAAATLVESQDVTKVPGSFVGKVIGRLWKPSFRGIIEIAEVAREISRTTILYDRLGITDVERLAPQSFDGFLTRFM